jgi:hypothetical protein
MKAMKVMQVLKAVDRPHQENVSISLTPLNLDHGLEEKHLYMDHRVVNHLLIDKSPPLDISPLHLSSLNLIDSPWWRLHPSVLPSFSTTNPINLNGLAITSAIYPLIQTNYDKFLYHHVCRP